MKKIDRSKPGAIVLGGNFVGLGIVRSLRVQGIEVWVLDADRKKSIAQFSRYTTKFVEVKGNIVDVLLKEGKEHNLSGWVLFPVTDECVEAVSANRETLSRYFRVTTAPPEITQIALDKRRTYKLAEELGVSAPWTFVAKSLAEVEAQSIPYPVILKPAVNHHFFHQTNIKALPVDAAADMQRAFTHMSSFIPPEEILVQERIPGGGENQFSFCAVCRKGHVYASLVAQRRRQYPVDFGNASTFVETTEQPIVQAAGKRFLESIGFDGLAEVEFKYDPRDGKYKILDVNPRTWGWHTLGKAAGIDFAYLMWQQAVGITITPIEQYRRAAWIREMTDFVSIAKSGNRIGSLKVLASAFFSRKFTSATFSIFDPAPFFAEIALWLSSGRSRQRKAKEFSQLDPVGSQVRK